MSQTALPLKDEGYTSPDFLANLFKKPLYTPISLTSIHSNSDETTSTLKENCSSPLLDSTNNALKIRNENRIYRSLSIIDDQKIQSKKYKIFFKTLLYGRLSEQEMNQIWTNLQRSISNPFEFDKLIQTTKAQREVQIQTENGRNKETLTKKQDLLKNPEAAKSKSIEKQTSEQYKLVRYMSNRKKQKNTIKNQTKLIPSSNLVTAQKKLILKQVSSIKAAIFKNECLIRKRTV